MASSCSIYDVDFENVAGKQELCIVEVMSEKMDLFPVDPP